MTDRRRAGSTRRLLLPVLLLVAGVALAVGAPALWSITHRDPMLAPIGQGTAVRLAESNGEAPLSTPSAGTLGAVPTATVPATTRSVPVAATVAPTTAAPRSIAPSTVPPSTVASSTVPTSTVAPGSAKATTVDPSRTARTAVPPSRATSSKAPPSRVTSSTKATPAPTVGAPARLQIPSVGIDAPVRPVGLDDQGDMAVPEQVDIVGWYEYGPAPGAAAGSAVLSGHIDSAQQGLGAFSALVGVKSGDRITVTDASGRQVRYRVVAREAFAKKTAPLADLFSRSGAPRLTLITCGGAFDSSARSYLDNIVVTAVPG